MADRCKVKSANIGDIVVKTTDSIQLVPNDAIVGIVADTKEIAKMDLEEKSAELNPDVDIAPKPVVYGYLTYPNFYRIKKWNNSSWYAIAIGELAEKLKQVSFHYLHSCQSQF